MTIRLGFLKFPLPELPEDAVTARAWHMYFIISYTLIMAGLIVGFVDLLFGNPQAGIIVLACSAGIGGTLLIAYRGNVSSACYVLFLILQSLLILLQLNADGFHDVATVMYPVIVVLGSLLLTKAPFIVFSLMAIVSLEIVIFAELQGWVVNKFSEHTTPVDMVSSFIILLITAVGARLLADTINTSYANARVYSRELEDSLKEREMLIRDIHHRVKNNMALISNMLILEQAKLDPDAEGSSTITLILEKTQERIFILAEIYSLLYHRDKAVSAVSADTFFHTLAELVGNLFPDRDDVELACEIDDVSMPARKLVPLGLMVNEIITNIFKHAFPVGTGGTIQCSFKHLANEQVQLQVSDDGPGIPGGLEAVRKSSMGIELIEGFVQQIDGELDIDTEAGVSYKVVFNV